MSTSRAAQLFGADPAVMGIVNVTPDSFSDGGKYINKNNAIDHGVKLLQDGAKILDVGGESTRPGAQVVDIEEEIDRVVPVIRELSKYADHISIDTRNAKTMRAALEAGATAINDISGLGYDSESINVASSTQVPVFIMHMIGTPQTMQDSPQYDDVVEDIYNYFQCVIKKCETSGIDKGNLILDPGIGFGKSLEHNLLTIRNISKFHDFGCPLLLGTSRKTFIAKASGGEPAEERLGGSISSVIYGRKEGVQIFRVHDVKETVQALKIFDAIENA